MSIIDQIDLSLEKASSLQQKRFEAEESKQKSLNYEINQLRSQFNESQDDQDEQMTPERSHSQNYSQSQYSPLRNDIKQLELQKQLLQSSERKLQQEIEDSDNDDNQLQIYPKYDKNINNKINNYNNNKNTLSKNKIRIKVNSLTKHKKRVLKNEIQEASTRKYISKERFIIKTQKVFQDQLKQQPLQQKEEMKKKMDMQFKNKNRISKVIITYKVCQSISFKSIGKNEKVKQETQNDDQNQYKIRGYRDQAEIKYFGRPLPCNECVFLLNKGMSSDYCSQHGKMNKERPPNKTLPKRLAKFLMFYNLDFIQFAFHRYDINLNQIKHQNSIRHFGYQVCIIIK